MGSAGLFVWTWFSVQADCQPLLTDSVLLVLILMLVLLMLLSLLIVLA
jgi:hypothetical protein